MYEFSLYRPIYSLPTTFSLSIIRQGAKATVKKAKSAGRSPWWERPTPFICYLSYAINTLGYSPFCFRVTSQILLLVSCLRSVRSARASGDTSRTTNTRYERLWAINFWDSLLESYKWPKNRI